MSKRIVIISFFMVFLTIVKAQEKMNYLEADKQSYELFQEKKWPELIKFSSEVRKQGIDFFYLQVRTGIAWYNQGKYQNAANWFLKAYENDQSLDWLQEYVYYSLIFSGRSVEAIKYASAFSQSVKKKINFKDIGVTHLFYESGYSYNPEFETLKSRAFKDEVNLGSDYGEAYFQKNYTFHSFDLSQRIAPNLTLNHNINYIGVNREAVVDWAGQTNSPIMINQFQYFINPVFLLGKKLNVSSSLNIIAGNRDVYVGVLNNNLSKSFTLSKTNYADITLSTAIWSNFGSFSPGLEINLASINDSKFIQMSSWVTFYPLANTKLYFTPRAYFKTGTDNTGIELNTMGISGGFQMGKIGFYGYYLVGNMENFIESVGYIISNFPGKSDRKIMGSINFPISKKNYLVFRYINQNIIETYQVYTDGYKSNALEYNYLKYTITGGISWNF